MDLQLHGRRALVSGASARIRGQLPAATDGAVLKVEGGVVRSLI